MRMWAAMVVLSGVTLGATKWEPDRKAPQGQEEKLTWAQNNWYKEAVSGVDDFQGGGPFSVVTGSNHPWGSDLSITFYSAGYSSPWWSYITVRDYTGGVDYIGGRDDCAEEDEWGDCIEDPMLQYVEPGSGFSKAYLNGYFTGQSNTGTGVVTTWSVPGVMDVQWELNAEGSSYEDSRVRFTITVTNTSSSQRRYGIRLLLDYYVGTNDGAYFYADGVGWTGTERSWDSPIPFQYYWVSEQNGGGTRFIFGNISYSGFGMEPTPPDHFAYVYWGDGGSPFGGGIWSNAWDDSNQGRTVGDVDAACAYWWGYNNPITLDPGQSVSVTQYIFASLEPVGAQEGDGPVLAEPLGTLVGDRLLLRVISPRTVELPVALYDNSGRLVLRRVVEAGDGVVAVPLPRLEDGVYILRLRGESYRLIKR